MAEAIYLACAALSVLCAVLLVRGYMRSRTRLLLWSSISFALLALNNLLLFADLVIWPEHDLSMSRSLSALAGMSVLVYGLVAESA